LLRISQWSTSFRTSVVIGLEPPQLGGISRALLPERRFLVGEGITLADICFVAELALFSNERLQRSLLEPRGLAPILDDVRSDAAYTRAFAHLDRLRTHPAFAPDVGPYLEKIAP
jgi:glutathione S-transferase